MLRALPRDAEQNLVLQTSTRTKGTDYLPYLDAVEVKIEEEAKLRITPIEGEPRWSKSLLHGFPTSATTEEVTISIQQSRMPARQNTRNPQAAATAPGPHPSPSQPALYY